MTKLTIPLAFEIYCSVHASFRTGKNMLGGLSSRTHGSESGTISALYKRTDYGLFIQCPNRFESAELFLDTLLAWTSRNGLPHITEIFEKETRSTEACRIRRRFMSAPEHWADSDLRYMLEKAPLEDWLQYPNNLYVQLCSGKIHYESVATFQSAFSFIKKTSNGDFIWDKLRDHLTTYSHFCGVKTNVVIKLRNTLNSFDSLRLDQ